MDTEQLWSLAGLWEYWRAPGAEHGLVTFTIITTRANDQVAPLHDRMPVILRPEDEEIWLDVEGSEVDELVPLLRPYTGPMALSPVSQAVNSAANNDPSLIEPLAA